MEGASCQALRNKEAEGRERIVVVFGKMLGAAQERVVWGMEGGGDGACACACV